MPSSVQKPVQKQRQSRTAVAIRLSAQGWDNFNEFVRRHRRQESHSPIVQLWRDFTNKGPEGNE